MPKFNMYQSLHDDGHRPVRAAVGDPDSTFAMHRRAEHGVAAHRKYKEDRAEGAGARSVVRDGEAGPITPTWRGCGSSWSGRRRPKTDRVPESLRYEMSQREVSSPPGRCDGPSGGLDPDRFRVCRAHRGRPPLRRCYGSTAWSPWSRHSRTVTSSKSSRPRPRVPARRATGSTSSTRRGRATRSGNGSPSPGARRWSRPAGSHRQGDAQTASAPAADAEPPDPECARRRVALRRRRRPVCRGSARASSPRPMSSPGSVAAVGGEGRAPGGYGRVRPGRAPIRRRGSEPGSASPGWAAMSMSSFALLHAGARRRHHRLRHPWGRVSVHRRDWQPTRRPSSVTPSASSTCSGTSGPGHLPRPDPGASPRP